MTIYYMRADGTAANKAAATSASDATTAMDLSVHNGETFLAGDIIVLSSIGGVFRGLSGAVIPLPSSGSSGNRIRYIGDDTQNDKPIVSGAADLTDTATYRWTESASGTNEYYCELLAGGNPSLSDPVYLWIDKARATEGTLGSLADEEWAYGNSGAELGYNTVYYRSDQGDPDTLDILIEAIQANSAMNVNFKSYLEFIDIEAQMCKINGWVVGNGDNFLFERVRGAYISGNGLLLFDSTAATIEDATVKDSEFDWNLDAGMTSLEENHNLSILGNEFHHNTLLGTGGGNIGGLHVKCDDDKRADNVLITGNRSWANGESGVAATVGNGMYIDTMGTGCLITDNRCWSNNAIGCVLEWTDGAIVDYNLYHDNGEHGLSLWRRSNSNQFLYNTSYANGQIVTFKANFFFGGPGGEGPGETMSDNVIKYNVSFDAPTNVNEVTVNGGMENDGTDGDNNVYDSNVFADGVGNKHGWDGTPYASAAAWQAAATGVTNTVGSTPIRSNLTSRRHNMLRHSHLNPARRHKRFTSAHNV